MSKSGNCKVIMYYLSSNPSFIIDYLWVLKTERECPNLKVRDREEDRDRSRER